MRKHTFLRAKNFLRRRAENAVFGGSFRQRRQKIPIPPAENPPASPMFHARVSRRKIRGKNRLATAVFHAVFGQNSRSFLHYYIERFYGAKLSARPHDLPLPFAALRRVCGQAFRLCRNCRAAAGAFRVGRKRRCRRRRQAFPQGRQSRALPARAVCTACFARRLWWFSRAAQDVGVQECFT